MANSYNGYTWKVNIGVKMDINTLVYKEIDASGDQSSVFFSNLRKRYLWLMNEEKNGPNNWPYATPIRVLTTNGL